MAELLSRNEWFDAMCADRRLSMADFAVASALRTFQNDRSDHCFPSHSTIARVAHCAVRTAERSTVRLQEFGYVRIGRWKHSNRYIRTLPPAVVTPSESRSEQALTPSQSRTESDSHSDSVTPHSDSESCHSDSLTDEALEAALTPTPHPTHTGHPLVVAARATAAGDISTLDGCAQLCDDFDRSGLSTSAVLDGLPTSVRSPIGLIAKRIEDLSARSQPNPNRGSALATEIADLTGIAPGPALSGLIAELRTEIPDLTAPLDEPTRTRIHQHLETNRNAA